MSRVGEGRQSGLTIDEFDRGVTYWRNRSTWPKDFHNELYQALAAENPDGAFTIDWWKLFLKRLRRWVATRPCSDAELTQRFTEREPQLSHQWAAVCRPLKGAEITAVDWVTVSAFPNVVGDIKPTKRPSPVFTSKFCHFLLPKVFPVVDNAALGGRWNSYESYFRCVQQEWEATSRPEREHLIARMSEVVAANDGAAISNEFPVVNKVVEICLIGRHHASQ